MAPGVIDMTNAGTMAIFPMIRRPHWMPPGKNFLTIRVNLRQQITDEQFELRNEMNKANPDSAKVAGLQKDLSKLNGELDQASVQYRLQVQKLVADQTN